MQPLLSDLLLLCFLLSTMCFSSYNTLLKFSSFISFISYVGISSGPGAFLLFNCLAMLSNSSELISSMLYFSNRWYVVILLFLNLCLLASFKSFCSWLGSPHCSLLKYSAAFCALSCSLMCSPSLVLLW